MHLSSTRNILARCLLLYPVSHPPELLSPGPTPPEVFSPGAGCVYTGVFFSFFFHFLCQNFGDFLNRKTSRIYTGKPKNKNKKTPKFSQFRQFFLKKQLVVATRPMHPDCHPARVAAGALKSRSSSAVRRCRQRLLCCGCCSVFCGCCCPCGGGLQKNSTI